jgi:hypothetical protein
MRDNHYWVFWTLLLALSLLTTAPATAQTQEPQRARTAQNCPSFNFDECLNACDRKLGAANPDNLGCAQLCKQSKDNCSAGRPPVDNPYLREGSAPSPPDDAKTAPSLAPSTPPPPAPRPAVTAPPPTNNPAQTFRTEDNQDIDGTDLGKFKNTDLEACASACNGESQCQAYSFDKWNRYCFLKSALTSRRLDPRSTTGIRRDVPTPPTAPEAVQMERYRGKVFPGAGYKATVIARFESCELTCQQDRACVAYTFQKADQLCRLFSSTGEYFANAQTDSGVKRQPPP